MKLLRKGVLSVTSREMHAGVDARLVDLEREGVVARVWAKDHTLWKPNPREITNRLGWLTVVQTLEERADLRS